MTRTALVTGGTRGIGAAIARALSDSGHQVVATYQGNDQAATAFTRDTGIATRKWDVADFEACQQGVGEVVEEFGSVDVLVNNAGITRDATLHKMELDDWNAVIATNLNSAFNMTRAVINGMREAGFGRIISIASVNGQKGQMGQANYAAAKAGLIGFTKSVAQENARRGVTANVVAPGYISTEMVASVPENVLEKIIGQIPVNRLGEAEEIGEAVAYLASDGAAFVTGSTLSINGGQYMV
ncbi:acetoacetyl-CoA reductase [Spiribacter vilamensis]|uniref:3-oxoacyl-[acyl-carrier-protein] reductase n=1 Tax=Spiribacter vilamensis TaxID=531306 RepID=A0A4Q8D054_9GAMM|nr:acetoacetyl-CoA reductase [Spiribacter vilamensis]RZU98632.1 3-oxoacyl-[acyl-carrier-protein] reductase [Spiribacter vilamensis]TVO60110.1 acetoacetyl-CoA reductase [Spiribacter vilamensis]